MAPLVQHDHHDTVREMFTILSKKEKILKGHQHYSWKLDISSVSKWQCLLVTQLLVPANFHTYTKCWRKNLKGAYRILEVYLAFVKNCSPTQQLSTDELTLSNAPSTGLHSHFLVVLHQSSRHIHFSHQDQCHFSVIECHCGLIVNEVLLCCHCKHHFNFTNNMFKNVTLLGELKPWKITPKIYLSLSFLTHS